MLAGVWLYPQPEVLMFNFIIGVVVGGVIAVAVPAAYAFIAKQIASVKAKV